MKDSSYVDSLARGALSQQSMTLSQIKQELGQGIAKAASDIGERDDWYMQVVEHKGLSDLTSLAQAFVEAKIKAIRDELCDAETRSLKERYKAILGDGETVRLLQMLVTAIVSVIAPEYSIPSVVIPLTLWLARVEIYLWCSSVPSEQILSVAD